VFIFDGEFYFRECCLLFIYGFIIHPRSGYSSRGLLIKTDNLYSARVVVNSVDVVSRLETTFVCLVSSG
jgi:hypothetical protein